MKCGADKKGEGCLTPFYCIFMYDYIARNIYVRARVCVYGIRAQDRRISIVSLKWIVRIFSIQLNGTRPASVVANNVLHFNVVSENRSLFISNASPHHLCHY